MRNPLPLLAVVALICSTTVAQANTDEWSWIVPLVTTKSMIEARFGKPVAMEESGASSYATSIGSLSVSYVGIQDYYSRRCSFSVPDDTVRNFAVRLTHPINVAETKYDLTGFIKTGDARIVFDNQDIGLRFIMVKKKSDLIATIVRVPPNWQKFCKPLIR